MRTSEVVDLIQKGVEIRAVSDDLGQHSHYDLYGNRLGQHTALSRAIEQAEYDNLIEGVWVGETNSYQYFKLVEVKNA